MQVPHSDRAIMPWSSFLRLLLGRACEGAFGRWAEGRLRPAFWSLSVFVVTRADSHSVAAAEDISAAACCALHGSVQKRDHGATPLTHTGRYGDR